MSGIPVVNMWWAHTPKTDEAGGKHRKHDQRIGRRDRLRVVVQIIIETIAAAGRKMM
jgi:hypothetical protein